ncbi:hypothetical protein N3K66_006818 [Trichothecium roseum]|uniref:Uncharacterized protein n=1 Tax=Trichothecium roseum TaxID=47278 RepID=A0ACC0UZ06_9HYPO|nr:hypothetical protein N3K66_006818 [Trichothecium roseum]
MSEELQDEIEAINSIYGPSTLVPAEDDSEGAAAAVYVLSLPGGASSLRVRFPAAYPAASGPEVLGTHSASGGVRGAGARDLGLFREVVAEVWGGMVCVFDAVDEFGRRLEEIRDDAGGGGDGDDDDVGGEGEEGEGEGKPRRRKEAGGDDVDIASLPMPPWVPSDPIVDSKSTFLGHAVRATSPEQARQHIRRLLHSDRRILNATHNVSAWRIRGEGAASYQDCDDDGETAAGGRMLRLLQLMDVWDVAVVVTRWYGGVKLGPRRFGVINQAAKDAVLKAGLGGDKDKEKEVKGKKK